MRLGLPELLIILSIFLLLFGAKRLPGLAKSLGRSTREFKSALEEQNSCLCIMSEMYVDKLGSDSVGSLYP